MKVLFCIDDIEFDIMDADDESRMSDILEDVFEDIFYSDDEE